MNDKKTLKTVLIALATAVAVVAPARAAEFYLRADVFTKTMPDNTQVTMWGFALDSDFNTNDGEVNVPGPLLTVPPGDTTLTIHMKNNLTAAQTGLPDGTPISLVIPGQIAPMTPVKFGATPYPEFEGRIRSLTHETASGNTTPVDYVWNNFKPGTYVYHSGTHMQSHVQMGLYGGVTKDYADTPYKQAYPNVVYETAVPIFFSEIDPAFHAAVASNNYGPGKAMTSTIDYTPKYFLINGEPFVSGQPLLPAGTHGGGTLLRLFNMGLKTRSALLQGSYMTLVAEDGQPYEYPKEQYAVLLPAGKTTDAIVAFPAAGTYPLYDRRLGLTNNLATNGGMLKRLDVGTGNFWPVITSITATESTIFDTQTSQLQVAVTDQDTATGSLVYAWEVPLGAGTVNDATIANPVFTPAYTGTTQTHTLKVTVSDGAGSPRVAIATVDVTVKPTPTPTSIEIFGPATVDENGTGQYTATAHFSDGSSASVQPIWSVDVAQASIDAAGLLTAGAVAADTPAVVSAEYTINSTTVSNTLGITILNAAGPLPTEVIVDNRDPGTSSVGTWRTSSASGFYGTDSVFNGFIGSSFTFTANLVPGTSYQVYAWWTNGSNRLAVVPHEIRDGTTLLDTVTVDQRINGSQWNLLGTYTFTGIASVTVVVPGAYAIADAVRFVPAGPAPTLQSIEIAGPATVNENTTGQYTATAHFSNGSTTTVQPIWSVDVAQASIDAAGLLTAGAVAADTPAVVSASYTLNGVTVGNTLGITILNAAVPAAPEVIVDNRDPGISSVGAWRTSASTGFYGTDSVFNGFVGNSFTFTANLAPGTNYQVYAWWTNGANRLAAVSHEIRDGATLLDTVTVDQRINGSQWNLLGTYTFTGTASVTVVVPGAYAIADAVRFVPVP